MRVLVLSLSLVLVRTAAAQDGVTTDSVGEQRGVITGTVSDATTKQPLADLVVTATSPTMDGEQVVVTDASGQYRIPNLPAGDYSLRFEKEMFLPHSRSKIRLREDRTLRVNVEVVPAGVEELVIHIGPCVPVIDLQSTGTGMTVSSDFLRNIPLRP
jgi:hypothetical protein